MLTIDDAIRLREKAQELRESGALGGIDDADEIEAKLDAMRDHNNKPRRICDDRERVRKRVDERLRNARESIVNALPEAASVLDGVRGLNGGFIFSLEDTPTPR